MDFLAGFAATVIHAVLMLPLSRVPWRIPMLAVQLGLAAAVCIAGAFMLALSGALGSGWHFAAAFAFGFMAYLFVFSAFYKSLSLRILAHMADRHNAEARIADLHTKIVARAFEERQHILLDGGLVARTSTGYVVTLKGQRLAARITWAKRAFGASGSGIYFSRS